MSEAPLARSVIDHLSPPILSSLGIGGQILFHRDEIIIVTFNKIAGRKILSFTKNTLLSLCNEKITIRLLLKYSTERLVYVWGAGEVQIGDRVHSDLTDLVRMA